MVQNPVFWCYRLKALVPQGPYVDEFGRIQGGIAEDQSPSVEILTPNVMTLGDGASWRWLDRKGRAQI